MTEHMQKFHPLIQKWFLSKYKNPTDIQEKGWKEIASGSHTLMTAPTGSGKTLAAFLWSLNQLITGVWPSGMIRILYISPLKALNNDVKKNLTEPLEELKAYFEEHDTPFPEIKIGIRSGDTSASDRQKMIRRPPEIFITTPETLNIMLTSGAAEKVLSGLSVVILDEIHAVAANKRGVHLISAVERLTLINGEFQRIGLSATVHPMALVASLLGGFYPREHEEEAFRARHVRMIQSDMKKQYEINVSFPETPEGQESHWPAVIEQFVERINTNRSTLIFCNTRRQTEKVSRMINEQMGETVAFAHHGSLSREIRYFVEQKMKSGELKAIVATSSLEMGIDIGTIDEVILLSAPSSVSSAVQRIGRGGHNVGDISRSTVFPMYGNDLLRSAVTAKAVCDGEIEALHVPTNPLDVLAQVLLSMCCTREWNIDELYLFITSVFMWQTLPRKHFDLVLEMLNGRYSDTRIGELKPRLNIDKIENTAKARDGAQRLIYMSGGTIPDRGYFELRIHGNGAKIGELDEEFVWERSHGDFFTLGAQTWRVDNITDRSVEVTPSDSKGAMSPFWKADPNGRDFFYSGKILNLLKFCESELSKPRGIGETVLREVLKSDYYLDEDATEALISFLKRQRDHAGGVLPHRNHLLIEHFNDPLNVRDCHQVILHTIWGGKINFPYSEALSQAWENKHGYPLQVFCDDDAVILDLPHEFDVNDVLSLVTGDNLEKLLRKRLESSQFFGGRFRHSCSTALLLPRKSFKQRTPLWLTRLRTKKLQQAVSRYDDFPMLTETWRSCLFDEFDLKSLTLVLDEIREGQIKVSEAMTKTPSPFSSGVVYDYTNQRMYEYDTPLAGQSNLREDLIKGIVHESGLRPMLPDELVSEFNQKLQRIFPDYCPRTADDLFDWVEERIFIPLSQWEEMKSALIRDLPEDSENIITAVEEKLLFWENDLSSETLVLSYNYKEKYGEAGFVDEIDFILPLWISFFGPRSIEYLCDLYPAQEIEILNFLETMRESEELIIDVLTENAEKDQFCTAENLEILFRLKRRKGRSKFKALPIQKLQLFLAQHQSLTQAGSGKDQLQEVFEKLLAYGGKAALWESDYFPSRIQPYYKSWLDTLFQESPLLWYGCGKEKIAFCFEEEQSLFVKKGKADKELDQLLPDKRGSFTFWDIKEHSRKSSSELSGFLWKKCWSGLLSNDHFSTVRTGIINKFSSESFKDMERKSGGRKISRGGFNRWVNTRPVEGRWFLTDSINDDEDLIEKDERLRDVIRQLFIRYGVLFRQVLERETDVLNWNSVFRTLRLMELSGECVSGYFFEDIRGIQFASWEALRELSEPMDEDVMYWMNCTDPASLSGIKVDALKGNYPSRLAGSHMVLRGENPILFSKRNGKELDFFLDEAAPDSLEALGFFKILLSREFSPLKSIKVETINGLPISESPYREILKQSGFRDNYNVFILSGVIHSQP
jgi:ATP-dependent helicase Lhr and Lhr-like helicase